MKRTPANTQQRLSLKNKFFVWNKTCRRTGHLLTRIFTIANLFFKGGIKPFGIDSSGIKGICFRNFFFGNKTFSLLVRPAIRQFENAEDICVHGGNENAETFDCAGGVSRCPRRFSAPLHIRGQPEGERHMAIPRYFAR